MKVVNKLQLTADADVGFWILEQERQFELGLFVDRESSSYGSFLRSLKKMRVQDVDLPYVFLMSMTLSKCS